MKLLILIFQLYLNVLALAAQNYDQSKPMICICKPFEEQTQECLTTKTTKTEIEDENEIEKIEDNDHVQEDTDKGGKLHRFSKHLSSSSSSSSSSKTIGKNSESSSVAKIENSEGSEENSFQLTKLPQAEKEQEKKTLDQKTLIKTLVEQRNQKRVCEPSKDISFIGVNSKGMTEIVSLEPLEDKCRFANKSPNLGPDFMLSDLDGQVHLYDGFDSIYKLSKKGQWAFVTNITSSKTRRLAKSGALAFSDGSWWLTGGLSTKKGNEPTSKTIFFDHGTGVVVSGRKLKYAQAGHCIVEVEKSFVSAGGFNSKDGKLKGFTQLYNITESKKWVKTSAMIIGRQGHACVSITTAHGQKMLAVGGLNQDKELVKEVEVFDTKTKTWKLDENRSIAYPTKKTSIVTIGCKVYLIGKDENGFGVIYILTENSWKLLPYKSQFSAEMIDGSFTSTSLHCFDFE